MNSLKVKQIKKIQFVKLSITQDEINEYLKKKYSNGGLLNNNCQTSSEPSNNKNETFLTDTYDFYWNVKNVAFSCKTIHCWNCHYEFSVYESIGIPAEYQNGEFHCYGNFCSFECAARYLFDKLYSRDTHYWEQLALLNTLYQRVYNLNSTQKIKMAPEKEVLKVFGGSIDYSEYRHCNVNKKVIQFYQLPLYPVKVYINSFKEQ